MKHSDKLTEVLAEGCMVRLVEDDIYSVLPDVPHKHLYDRRAAAYDSIVSTWLYNRLMWGASPLDYVAFAREAVASHPAGQMLDAGCGSLLFTAQVYLGFGSGDHCLRSVVADAEARACALDRTGRLRPRAYPLIASDLSNLVFRPENFHTILCMNVLHQFAGAAEMISKLKDLLADGGSYI